MSTTTDIPGLINAILQTITYADVFDYPLTVEEIHRYLTCFSASLETVLFGLDAAPVTHIGKYYTLPGRESIVAIRVRREQIAARMWSQAYFYGKIIGSLPFVRMVAVTGSLSMNNIEANGDIDYLVVTANDHFWLCRLLILVVTRVASWHGVKLCPNYLISERSLKLTNHSLYAAHEFAQMVPLSGLAIYLRMQESNPWVKDFLPNADEQTSLVGETTGIKALFWLSSIFEWFLRSYPGAWLERWEMGRKTSKLSLENIGNPEAIFNADVCKGHSNRHAQRTEMLLNERLIHFAMEPVPQSEFN